MLERSGQNQSVLQASNHGQQVGRTEGDLVEPIGPTLLSYFVGKPEMSSEEQKKLICPPCVERTYDMCVFVTSVKNILQFQKTFNLITWSILIETP